MSGRDYFSQAVPNNSRMGSGIAPNGYPTTPISTVHDFSERNAYNNPASRFLVNSATPSSAGSSQIHHARGLYTPARKNQDQNPMTPIRVHSGKDINGLELPNGIMQVPNTGLPPQ